MYEWLRIQRLTELPGKSRRVQHKFLPEKLSQEEFCSYGSQPPKDARQLQRCYAINTKHVNGLGVVAEHRRTAFARSPPKTLPSKRYLPISDIQSHIRVEETQSIRRI